VTPPARVLAALLLAAALGGCASATWWPFRPAAMLLMRADRAADELRFRQALALYDEFLARYPDDVESRRALESRDTVAAIVTTREELARMRGELRARELEARKLRDEVNRLRQEMTSRQAESDKLRAESDKLRAESDKLRAESDKLRTDLERMKELDLKLERRR
jgi:chromosome segregation ATPase